MKKSYIYPLLAALLISTSTSYSQEQETVVTADSTQAQAEKAPKRNAAKEKADKKYAGYAYIDAIEIYERLAEKGYRSAELYEKLGNAYYFNSEFKQAEKWYGELFSMGEENITPETYYRYAQSLKSIGEYKKANQYLDTFAKKQETDTRAIKYTNNKNYLEKIEANSGRYNIENSAINSPYSDYGAASYNGYVVFTSSRDTTGLFRRTHKWTNQSFTNLYVAKQSKDGKLSEATPFLKTMKGKYHESTPAITKDGQTIYFTRNNAATGDKGVSPDKIRLLKIYKAHQKDGKWDNIQELPFNSNNYSCAHPALSPDEKTLYFASDMPGGKGGTDLYKVSINNSQYGKPENLGDKINTAGRESFPYISKNNELYFSSDGHPGLGGLDVFATRKEKDSTYQIIHNVGKPLNGPMDDFAYIIDNTTKRGYFSSNREGGKGYDDLYNLLETRSLFTCEQLIKGKAVERTNNKPIPNVSITLYDINFKEIGKTKTDAQGNYSLEMVQCGTRYYVRADKERFHTQEHYVPVPDERGETTQDFSLDIKEQGIPVGTDLFGLLNLNEILFDLDKSNIRPDAAIELDKVVAVLKDYPTMKIDIRAHTDSRGSAGYNERLSTRRASSTMQYMIDQGISKYRLSSKGYGESKLLNKCADKVPCTDEEHQKNRRSEFIVTEM